jgi:hypothetical protein
MMGTKRPSGQTAFLPNIKIEKTQKQFFFTTTPEKRGVRIKNGEKCEL